MSAKQPQPVPDSRPLPIQTNLRVKHVNPPKQDPSTNWDKIRMRNPAEKAPLQSIQESCDEEKFSHTPLVYDEVSCPTEEELRVPYPSTPHTRSRPLETDPQTTPVEDSILLEAKRLTEGARNRDYGPPQKDFKRTATMVAACLRENIYHACLCEGLDADTAERVADAFEISPSQWALCMVLVKVSREVNSSKRDNWVDIAGYADVGYKTTLHED